MRKFDISPSQGSSPPADEPEGAAQATTYVRDCLRKWRQVRAENDDFVDNRENAARVQKSLAQYIREYSRLLTGDSQGRHHAHSNAYNAVNMKLAASTASHFGAIPSITPGTQFLNKAHAGVCGVHRQIYKNISAGKIVDGISSPVESIVVYGEYQDTDDEGATLWYNGEGMQKDGVLLHNQSLSSIGNLGLALNCEGNVPVRVMRRLPSSTPKGTGGSPKALSTRYQYVYDGLYNVVQWKRSRSCQGTNSQAPVVLMYKLKRVASETGRQARVDASLAQFKLTARPTRAAAADKSAASGPAPGAGEPLGIGFIPPKAGRGGGRASRGGRGSSRGSGKKGTADEESDGEIEFDQAAMDAYYQEVYGTGDEAADDDDNDDASNKTPAGPSDDKGDGDGEGLRGSASAPAAPEDKRQRLRNPYGKRQREEMDGKEEGGDPAAAAATQSVASEKTALGFKPATGKIPSKTSATGKRLYGSGGARQPCAGVCTCSTYGECWQQQKAHTNKNAKRQRQSGPPPLSPKTRVKETSGRPLNQAKPPKRVKNEGSKSSRAARPNCAKLCNAAHRGQLPVVQGLLNKRSDANAKNRRGIPALNLAAEQGHTAVMHLLLQHGASVAATDTNGNTALHYAAMQKEEGSMVNKVEATNLLLQHGGDAMAKRSNTDGSQHDTYTALHLAVSSRHVNTVRALLKHDSSAAAATDEDTGLTALHLAAQLSNVKLVQLLLEHDAPQDLTTKYAHIPYDAPQDTLASDSLDNPMRFTPLMFAAHAGGMDGMECVRTLLSAGADATVRCPNYGTAERIAEEEGHSAIAALLRQHTAGGTASSAQHAGGVSVDHRLSLSRLRMDSLYSYGKRRREEIGGKEAGGDPAAAAAAHSAIVGPIVERRLAGMMSEGQRQKSVVPRLLTWNQCSYNNAYDDCGKPRDKQGAWANPIEAVARCFPQCFNIDQWKQALEKTAGGLKDKNDKLEHAGAACAHLWTAGWMFDLVNKVNATQYTDVMTM